MLTNFMLIIVIAVNGYGVSIDHIPFVTETACQAVAEDISEKADQVKTVLLAECYPVTDDSKR